jgi:hypothetical protein
MRNRASIAWFLGMLGLAAGIANARPQPASEEEHNAIVVIFKDGHQQSFPAADVARLELKPPQFVFRDSSRHSLSGGEITRIEFKSAATSVSTLGQNHFIGKWRCGDGAGGTFLITLLRNGEARKTIGSTRGSWTVVNGEAHISWDDGWHDIIRKVDTGHEKAAFAPGRSLSEEPTNIATARNISAEPI